MTRATLFSANLTNLVNPLSQAFEHPDDDNFVRNKINNISSSIIDNATLGRKTFAYKLEAGLVEGVLAGLKANFPDTQFVSKVAERDDLYTIRVFWS